MKKKPFSPIGPHHWPLTPTTSRKVKLSKHTLSRGHGYIETVIPVAMLSAAICEAGRAAACASGGYLTACTLSRQLLAHHWLLLLLEFSSPLPRWEHVGILVTLSVTIEDVPWCTLIRCTSIYSQMSVTVCNSQEATMRCFLAGDSCIVYIVYLREHVH